MTGPEGVPMDFDQEAGKVVHVATYDDGTFAPVVKQILS
jgi:hypothetical protein